MVSPFLYFYFHFCAFFLPPSLYFIVFLYISFLPIPHPLRGKCGLQRVRDFSAKSLVMPKAYTHVLVSVGVSAPALTATNILKHVYTVRQCRVFKGVRCVSQSTLTILISTCERKELVNLKLFLMFILEKSESSETVKREKKIFHGVSLA